MELHMSNISYMILNFLPEILWYVLFPKELVALNLDFLSFRYDLSTKNTCLRPILGLVNNPNIHGLYFLNYSV
jgi:hypothetical protein